MSAPTKGVRLREAETAFENALDLKPEAFESWNGLGVTRVELGDLDGASEAFEESLRIMRNVKALANMARIALRQRDLGTAEAYAQEAILLDAETWLGHLVLAEVCVVRGDRDNDRRAYSDATVAVTAAVACKDLQGHQEVRAQALLMRGYARVQLDDFRNGIRDFGAAEKLAGPSAPIRFEARRNRNKVKEVLQHSQWAPALASLAVAVVAVATLVFLSVLLARQEYDATAYAVVAPVLIFLVLAASLLPVLSRLKVGPAELERTSSSLAPPKIEIDLTIPAESL